MADLAAYAKLLDVERDPAHKQELVRVFVFWKQDPDLAGIREEASLANLPEGEREGFRALWADVEALRKRAEAGVPAPPKQ